MAHRRRSKVPPPPARHDPTGDRDRHPDGQGLLEMQRLAGNQATRQAVEHPLDAGVRGHLERRFGVDLGAVRVRRDGAAAARAGAPAYTVGDRITVDPAHHRPGTLAGDLLLAHEVAHSVQQRHGRAGGHATDDAALEADADRAAVATVAQPATGGFLPALRSALSLRRCRACTPDEEAWLTRFRDESDGERLAALLGDLTGEQLRRLERAPRVDQLHTDAVAWERAWRDRRFSRMSELTRDSDEALRTAYGRRVVTGVVAGGLRLRVTSEDDGFRAFVEGALTTLAGTRHGLQLIVDLLATGQQVDLAPAAPGTGDVTEPVRIEDARLATQITDESHPDVGAPLPPGQQRPGAGTGSIVRLDTSTAGNRVTLGGTRDRPTIIAMDPAVTVGHELIHALHNARGINIGVGLTRRLSPLADPLTGEPVNPEELHAISGRTEFSPVTGLTPADLSLPTRYNVPPTVTENQLRADLELPERAAHFGATETIRVRKGATATVDDLVARYRLPGGPVPPAGAAAIRAMLPEAVSDAALAELPADFDLPLPHPDHVLLRIRFVERDPALADAMDGLTVR